jgi:hypothetical protein
LRKEVRVICRKLRYNRPLDIAGSFDITGDIDESCREKKKKRPLLTPPAQQTDDTKSEEIQRYGSVN